MLSASRRAGVSPLSDPADVAVGPNQHGSGSSDRAEHRKLPRTGVSSVDQLDAVSPRSDVEAARLAEVEQHRLCVVEQLEDPERAVGGCEVEVGHPPSQQRMSVAEVVVDIQPGDDAGEPLARLVHDHEL